MKWGPWNGSSGEPTELLIPFYCPDIVFRTFGQSHRLPSWGNFTCPALQRSLPRLHTCEFLAYCVKNYTRSSDLISLVNTGYYYNRGLVNRLASISEKLYIVRREERDGKMLYSSTLCSLDDDILRPISHLLIIYCPRYLDISGLHRFAPTQFIYDDTCCHKANTGLWEYLCCPFLTAARSRWVLDALFVHFGL